MHRARKTFAPQAGLGIQIVEQALHRALLEAGLAVLDNQDELSSEQAK